LTEKLFVIKYHTMMNARPKKFSLAYLASLLIQCHISQYTHYSNFKLAAECQENATLVAGFFSLKTTIISSQQFIYQVQFCLDLPCILLCASMKREFICENGITLCFITYQPYQNQERTAVALYLYKTSQRGLVLMFLPPTDLEVRYYRKQ